MIRTTTVLLVISLAGLLAPPVIHAEDDPGNARNITELKILRFGSSNTHGVGDLSRLATATGKYQFKNRRWYTLSFKGLWEDIQTDEKNHGKSFRKHHNTLTFL